MRYIKNIIVLPVLLLFLLIIGYILSPPQKEVSIENINDSIILGTSFLKKQVAEDSLFLTCEATGESSCPVDDQGTSLVAFFIVDTIGSELSSVEREIIISRLTIEERNGLWGYSRNAPIDSDDSAFVLHTFKLLNVSKSLENITVFYNKQGKGFITFQSDISPKLAFQPSEDNNFHIHPEVNANIYNLIHNTSYKDYINYDIVIDSQASDGYWHSYFYPSNYYSTYQNLKFLSLSENYNDIKEKSVTFLLSSQNNDGSWGNPGNAYETSLALKSLATLNISNDQFWKGIKFLLNSQNNNGSWQNSTIIWEYIFQQNPLVIWQAFDKNMVISTSLSIGALKDAKQFEIP